MTPYGENICYKAYSFNAKERTDIACQSKKLFKFQSHNLLYMSRQKASWTIASYRNRTRDQWQFFESFPTMRKSAPQYIGVAARRISSETRPDGEQR